MWRLIGFRQMVPFRNLFVNHARGAAISIVLQAGVISYAVRLRISKLIFDLLVLANRAPL